MFAGLLGAIGDRRNVAGLVGAAAGLGLTFGGMIDAGWWAITGGLYAVGFLGTQILAPPALLDIQAAPVAELPEDLRRLARRIGPQLPPAAQTHLTNILAAVAGIEPKLRAIDPNNLSVISVRQILADYIPTTLTAYAALPPRVRSSTRFGDGRTAEMQITEQLALLERQMDEVADNLSRGDLTALENQGRFLDEKFREPEVFGT